MKKLLFTVVFFTTLTVQYSHAQDNTIATPLSVLLNSYLDIKNALVATDATTTSVKAGELVKAIEDADMKALSQADHTAFMALKEKLAFDARHISESKDISHQREHFSSLSNNIYKLAKAVKLSAAPVYQEYCPMKKMYWLSSEAAIKNPYYGKMMLTCGKVTETLK